MRIPCDRIGCGSYCARAVSDHLTLGRREHLPLIIVLCIGRLVAILVGGIAVDVAVAVRIHPGGVFCLAGHLCLVLPVGLLLLLLLRDLVKVEVEDTFEFASE